MGIGNYFNGVRKLGGELNSLISGVYSTTNTAISFKREI